MSSLIVLGYILLSILSFVLLFIAALYLGTIIPVNRKFKHVENGIDIFLTSNGMHVDFILPTKNKIKDWTQFIDSQPYNKHLSEYKHIGIGWGAPEFYLELETWDHVPFNLGFRAMAIPTPTIMHVIGYDKIPYEELKVARVSISEDQYLQLCSFISDSFKQDDKQALQLIPNRGYNEHDNFYHAHGVYHIFHTCNYWVNKGLKRIGVYAPLWSPLERGIFYQLDQLNAKTGMKDIMNQEKVIPAVPVVEVEVSEVL